MKVLGSEEKRQVSVECDRILADDSFIRSPMLSALLRFLLKTTLADEQPKEITIGIEVFNKPSSFDPSTDAFVRVYMHKLRARIAEFYASETTSTEAQVCIPKGSYQLQIRKISDKLANSSADQIDGKPVAQNIESKAKNSASEGLSAVSSRKYRSVLVTSVILFVLAVCFAALSWHNLSEQRQLLSQANQDAKSNATAAPMLQAFWQAIERNGLPTYIVLGDVFMVEYALMPSDESTGGSERISTLMRNYDINSNQDFAQWQTQYPAIAESMRPSANRFLMQSSAYTLISLNDVVNDYSDNIIISTLSDLDAKSIRDANFVYVGMIKSMGYLRTYFEDSAFDCENNCKHSLLSDSGLAFFGEGEQSEEHTDYAAVAKTIRNNGAVSVFLAGFSDTGIMQAVRTVTDETELSNSMLQAQALATDPSNNDTQITLESDISFLFEAKGFDYADYAASLIMVDEFSNASAVEGRLIAD